jgi:hypothetical protein
MSSRNYDGSEVRKIVTGMVHDKYVCARIASIWPAGGLFSVDWANIVGQMIVKHYRTYERNPGASMRSVFEEWAVSPQANEQTIGAVERFLQSLPDEMDEPTEYVLDLAGRHFNRVYMNAALTEVKQCLDHGLNDEALDRILNFKRINLGEGSYQLPLDDPGAWMAAGDYEKQLPLVSYRGDLDAFFNGVMQRGRLISFMAPDKTGKSFWLVDLVYRALREGRRVAYFDLGDGDQDDFLSRLACRTTGQPLYASEVNIPLPESSNSCTWGSKLEHQTVPMPGADMIVAKCELTRLVAEHSPENYASLLRTAFHAASTLDVQGLDSILHDWDRAEGWHPDVVVLDYADLLAAPQGIKEVNEQIDTTWKLLHAIGKKHHCLVVTATQTSAKAYANGEFLLSKEHFQGRKTKLAHVDAMIGINVTPAEREKGVSRINFIVRRKGAYSEKRYVTVAGCLGIGNPAILSKLDKHEAPVEKSEVGSEK